MEIGS